MRRMHLVGISETRQDPGHRLAMNRRVQTTIMTLTTRPKGRWDSVVRREEREGKQTLFMIEFCGCGNLGAPTCSYAQLTATVTCSH
jgi:hypothetical protein